MGFLKASTTLGDVLTLLLLSLLTVFVIIEYAWHVLPVEASLKIRRAGSRDTITAAAGLGLEFNVPIPPPAFLNVQCCCLTARLLLLPPRREVRLPIKHTLQHSQVLVKYTQRRS